MNNIGKFLTLNVGNSILTNKDYTYNLANEILALKI